MPIYIYIYREREREREREHFQVGISLSRNILPKISCIKKWLMTTTKPASPLALLQQQWGLLVNIKNILLSKRNDSLS
jgi:hypothetical protein